MYTFLDFPLTTPKLHFYMKNFDNLFKVFKIIKSDTIVLVSATVNRRQKKSPKFLFLTAAFFYSDY